jgi:spoIIIJ-associated protein
MTSIEQTGKNIDEATRLALERLRVTEDEVDVEILEEGSKGFLGLGQTPARVRVTVKKVQPAPRAEAPAPKPKPRQRPRPRPKSKPEAKKVQETKPTVEQQPVAEERPVAKPAEPAPAISEEKLQQAAEKARELLQVMLDGIGAGGTASVANATDGQVSMNVDGGDAAILIGKRGQTIDAIQYLVSVITHQQTGTRVRILIDVGGYRTRREEALRDQALYFAEKVKESGQEAVLDALNANERRVIHATLADNPDVYTYSEGQEPERHVVISPKK